MNVEAHFATATNVAIFLMAAGNLCLFLGLAFLALRLKSILAGVVDEALGKVLPKIQPIMDNVGHITGQVSDLVGKVAPHVESIAAEGEGTVHSVSNKVKASANLVTEGVAKPIVNIASVLTGVQKGLEVWNSAKEHNGDGSAPNTAADGTARSENRQPLPPESLS